MVIKLGVDWFRFNVERCFQVIWVGALKNKELKGSSYLAIKLIIAAYPAPQRSEQGSFPMGNPLTLVV